MGQQMKYRVVRQHQGDRDYVEGEIRTADPSEVGHLVPNVLELLGPAPKPKARKPRVTPQNKSEGNAPCNKQG